MKLFSRRQACEMCFNLVIINLDKYQNAPISVSYFSHFLWVKSCVSAGRSLEKKTDGGVNHHPLNYQQQLFTA